MGGGTQRAATRAWFAAWGAAWALALSGCAGSQLGGADTYGLSGVGSASAPGESGTSGSSEEQGGESGDDIATTESTGLGESGDDPEPPPDEDTTSGGEDEPEPLPPPPPGCGDAIVDPGEQCDDGNAVDGDACVHCQNARCGDGVLHAGAEACDDGNGDDHDACLDSCAVAICGDGVLRDDTEVCDDGVNDGDYGGCLSDCSGLAAFCGDGNVDAIEQCDPEVQLPYAHVGCDDDACLYDFGGIPQLYCNGTCSWSGNYGCDQADADILCKLTTGDPGSTASSWDLAYSLDAPGFSCPGVGVNMGAMPEFGVGQAVYYQDFSIAATHGLGIVVVNPTCT